MRKRRCEVMPALRLGVLRSILPTVFSLVLAELRLMLDSRNLLLRDLVLRSSNSESTQHVFGTGWENTAKLMCESRSGHNWAKQAGIE